MTFLTMMAIAAYLAIGAYTTYRVSKDDIAKLPAVWKNEHLLTAVGYTGFIIVMFLFGMFVFWPWGLMIGVVIQYGYLSKKYEDK